VQLEVDKRKLFFLSFSLCLPPPPYGTFDGPFLDLHRRLSQCSNATAAIGP